MHENAAIVAPAQQPRPVQFGTRRLGVAYNAQQARVQRARTAVNAAGASDVCSGRIRGVERGKLRSFIGRCLNTTLAASTELIRLTTRRHSCDVHRHGTVVGSR